MAWPTRPRRNRRNRFAPTREQPAFAAPLVAISAIVGLTDDNIVLVLFDDVVGLGATWRTVPITCTGDPTNVHFAGYWTANVADGLIQDATPSTTPTNCIGIEFTAPVPGGETIVGEANSLIRSESGGYMQAFDLNVGSAE